MEGEEAMELQQERRDYLDKIRRGSNNIIVFLPGYIIGGSAFPAPVPEGAGQE